MVLQRFFIGAGFGSGDALEDVKDDGGKAGGFEVDLLVVGDLANLAVRIDIGC